MNKKINILLVVMVLLLHLLMGWFLLTIKTVNLKKPSTTTAIEITIINQPTKLAIKKPIIKKNKPNPQTVLQSKPVSIKNSKAIIKKSNAKKPIKTQERSSHLTKKPTVNQPKPPVINNPQAIKKETETPVQPTEMPITIEPKKSVTLPSSNQAIKTSRFSKKETEIVNKKNESPKSQVATPKKQNEVTIVNKDLNQKKVIIDNTQSQRAKPLHIKRAKQQTESIAKPVNKTKNNQITANQQPINKKASQKDKAPITTIQSDTLQSDTSTSQTELITKPKPMSKLGHSSASNSSEKNVANKSKVAIDRDPVRDDQMEQATPFVSQPIQKEFEPTAIQPKKSVQKAFFVTKEPPVIEPVIKEEPTIIKEEADAITAKPQEKIEPQFSAQTIKKPLILSVNNARWRKQPILTLAESIRNREKKGTVLTVIFQLEVDKYGNINHVKKIQSSGNSRVDRVATKTIKQAQFYPFKDKDTNAPVAGIITIPLIYPIY